MPKNKSLYVTLLLLLACSGCGSRGKEEGGKKEAATSPTPAQIKEFDASGKLTRCGEFRINIVPGSNESGGGSVEIANAKGNPIEKISGYYIPRVQCEDLLGDDQVELIVEDYSGGAHCCSTYYVYSPRHRKMLLMAKTGNGSLQDIKDLNRDGKKELIASDDRLAYFGGLSYAASPMLPLIFCYREGQYTDCTRDFPDLLNQAMQESEAGLKQSDADEISNKRNALAIYALGILLGKESETWQRLQAMLPKDTRVWLETNRAAIQQRMQEPRDQKG
jgi:hypothetical protein